MRTDTYPRRARRAVPVDDPTDPEWMYPPVVTGPPPPELPRAAGAPLEVNGAEYNFEMGAYWFVWECDAGEEFRSNRYGALKVQRVFCDTCHQHHELAPIRGA